LGAFDYVFVNNCSTGFVNQVVNDADGIGGGFKFTHKHSLNDTRLSVEKGTFASNFDSGDELTVKGAVLLNGDSVYYLALLLI